MKLLRFEHDGKPALGVMRGADVVPLDGIAGDYPTMMSIIEGGATALAAVQAASDAATATLPLAGLKLLAPVEKPGKWMAIGMNYAKHVEEAKKLGVAPPQHQYWFNKQTTCVAGPYDDTDPGVSEALDYEVELCVVIGAVAKSVSTTDAPAHVFGYMVCNDVSARDWQKHSPTFTMGKSFDTHGPIGPWIVTADEIADPHTLNLRCYVNGEERQSGNTSELIHSVWSQISYLSTAFTLEPGDLIATGTPSGVGAAMDPPVFLKPGDVVRCEIDGIGAIENKVKAAA